MNRLNLRSALGWVVLFIAGGGTFMSPGCAVAPKRPNIVIILADDMGFSDLGCYGSSIATPNLDRMATQGLRFTQFYNCARCCPSRAALLTGLYPHQTGVGHMLGNWSSPGYTNGLNDHCATIAELLGQAGYHTYMAGKWHVGGFGKDQSHNLPRQRGFERFYGTAAGGNYFAPKPLLRDNAPIQPEGETYYTTNAFSDEAVRFIDDHRATNDGRPFFLYLCYTAPHFPLQALPKDIAKYRGKFIGGWDEERQRRYERQKCLGIIDPKWPLGPRDPLAMAWADASDQEEWELRMAVYAAMIDCMDRGIGRVMDALKRADVADDTVVLFLSDNGASAEFLDSWPDPTRGHKPGSMTGTRDSHRCLEVGWANACNTPFREHKMWVHEGGISTPLIAYWPKGIYRPGRLNCEVGHIIDLMPTCLELAGVPYPASFHDRALLPLEGRSLVPALRDKSTGDERTLCWEHQGNRAIRRGPWKLVAAYQGPWELYNMTDDRTETVNLAARYPDRVEELAGLWQAWADRIGVVPWEELPGSRYKPTASYSRKGEPVSSD